MSVREFTLGSGARMNWSAGGLTGMTHGTVAALFKLVDTANWRTLYAVMTSGGTTFRSTWIQFTNTDLQHIHNGTTGQTLSAIAMGVWVTMVKRKTTGTTTARRSYYNHTTGLWTHTAAGGTLANMPSMAGTDVMSTSTGPGSELFDGRLAVWAAWNNVLPWTADASGDTAIEAAGLEDSLANWVAASPSALVPLNQASTSTPADDIVGTSNQALNNGTNVVEGDDPPGFSFDLGPPPPTPNLYVGRSTLRVA